MKKTKITYTVAREGHEEIFDDKTTAKLVYQKTKEDYPETVLRKTIETIEVLEYHENSGCWL